jgi:putrescine transport system ATP-binding protein
MSASPVPANDEAALASERPLLRFDHVGKRFGTVAAVERLSLDIRAGELFALLGPSGCGKSTLLRLAAGLETPDEGRIILDGQDVTHVPPHLRPVNMMFQHYALFPHMTVAGNVAFGLKQERLPRAAISARVDEALALLRLDGLEKRRPDQLSGGQRQRVALARALVKRPKVLLLDEPLAALDKKLRDEMQTELAGLRRRLGTTFVIVTHDQQEAMSLADRLAVMDRGRIAQVGAPADVYERPGSVYVAGFMGDVNLLEGTIARSDAAGVQVDCGRVGYVRVAVAPRTLGARAWIAVRPEKVALMPERPDEGGINALQGSVEAISYFGASSLVSVRAADGRLLRSASIHAAGDRSSPAIGTPVWLTWPATAATLLDH